MPVEMIIDQWNPSNVRYRLETFCYGPKSCTKYRPGPYWIYEEEEAHQSNDE